MRRIDPSAFDTRLCSTPGCPNEVSLTDLRAGAAAGKPGECGECQRGEGIAFRIAERAAGVTGREPEPEEPEPPRAPRRAVARTGQPTGEQLTPAEMRVLTSAAAVLDAAGTADRLGVTVSTVRAHTKRILRKLGARNQAHAVAIALRTRVLEQGAAA